MEIDLLVALKRRRALSLKAHKALSHTPTCIHISGTGAHARDKKTGRFSAGPISLYPRGTSINPPVVPTNIAH